MDRNTQIEYLLDHFQNPRHHGEMADADLHLQGGHPGCSDVVTVYLKIEDGKVADISFVGEGCTISQAGTSIMSEEVIGRPVSEVEAMDFHTVSELIGEDLVKTRPRCATLGLDTIKGALQEYRRKQILGE